MAGEVQLKLGVSLDLGYFRTEMQKAVNIVNSEFTGRLKVKFDRQILDRELNNLQRAIRRRTYRIEIGGNIDALPGKIKNLQQSLRELEGFGAGVGVTVRAAVTKKDARKVRSDIYRQIISEGGKILLPVGLAPISQAAADKFRADLLKKIGSLTVKVKADVQGGFGASPLGAAGLEQYMRTQGLSGGNMPNAVQVGRSERLRKALEDLTVKQLQALAKEEGIGGVSKLKKDPLIQKLVTDLQQETAERILGNIKNQLQNPLDIVARGIFRMLGIDPQSLREKRLPPAINWQATTPERAPSIGPSSTGRALSAGRASAGLISAAQAPIGLLPSISGRSQIQATIEALIAQQGPRMLPSGGGPLVDTKKTYAEINKRFDQLRQRMFTVLEADVKEVSMGIKDSLNSFAFLVQALKDAETRSKNNRIDEQVDAFFASIESALHLATARAKIEAVRIQDLGAQPARGALPPGRVPPSPLLLPAAGGTGGYFGGGRRPGGGFVPEGGFPNDGPIAPFSAMARQLPAGYLEMGKFASQLREADKYLKQSKIPLAGAIEELGGEFAEATKQVLLYGTAYKALAFFTSLPQQAFDAAKALQTFNNQLNAITGGAQAAGRASAFVSSVVEQFNIPLDSARQGFTRLYASMQPAGISSQTIEGLFTGISKASATLGLSSDQVDRVTYAFSQMASKGQIMSEEVSGQLGDVIPGALSIMAQAAGMSMSDFKVAMEKGQLSGKALEQVFANLEIVLDQRFGKGAQGAANTLQGMVNAMQTAMIQLYQSFEPIVGAVASAFGPQITALISDGAAAVTAFAAAVQGSNGPANMLSENGKTIYSIIQQVAEIFKATGSVIEGIAPTLAMLGKTILTIVEYIGKFINTPVGGFLADLALKAGLVLAAMQAWSALMKLQLIANIIDFTRVTLASTTGLVGFTKATWTAVAATKAFRLALIGLGAGAVLLAIEALISKLSEAAGKMERLRKSTVDTIDSIRQMDQAQARQASNQTQSDLKAIAGIEKNKKVGKDLVEITEDQYKALERAKVPGLTRTVTGRGSSGRFNVPAFDPTFAEAARQNLQRQQAEADKRLRDLQSEGSQQALQKVDLGAGKDAAKDGSKAAEKLANQQQQLAIDAAKRQGELDKALFEGRVSLSEQEFEHFKALVDAKNDYELSGLDSIQARQLKHQQELKKIELERISTVRKLQAETAKAAVEQIAAQRTAMAAGGATGGRTGLFQGSTGVSTGPHFDIRKPDGSRITEAEARAIFSERVNKQLTMTSGYGPRRAPTRGASSFHRGIDLAGPPGTPLELAAGYSLSGDVKFDPGLGYHQGIKSPQGQSFIAAHLQKPGASYTRGRKEAQAAGKQEVEQIQLQNKALLENEGLRFSTIEAIEKVRALIAQNIDTIYPVAEQQLENRLLAMRNSLQLQGMPQKYISFKEQSYKADYEAGLALIAYKKNVADAELELNRLQQKKKDGIALTEAEVKVYGTLDEGIKRLTGEIEEYKKAIADLPVKQLAFTRELLKNTIESLKNADAIKKQQEALERVDSAVSGTVTSYKNLMQALIKGPSKDLLKNIAETEAQIAEERGQATPNTKKIAELETELKGLKEEATTGPIKQFQEALADQFTGMFLDYAMKPVESFMKEAFANMFGIKTEEQARKEALTLAEQQLKAIEEQMQITKEIKKDTGVIASGGNGAGQSPQSFASPFSAQGSLGSLQAFAGTGGAASIFGSKEMTAAMESAQSFVNNGGFTEVSNQLDSLTSTANAFTGNFKLNIGSLKDSNEGFKQVNMDTQKNGLSFTQALGKTVQGIGIAATTVMGIMSGINQIKEGGTSNTLAGIGSIFMSLGSAVGGFVGMGLLPGKKAANGGIATGGWKPLPVHPFATGGIVNGPTLGLVGEGKYNEAIVPLPDGRSIPVMMKGSQPSSRELLSSNSSSIASSPVLNMSFESTVINGVEYVSRDQLEAAMMETRKLAARDGANRGAALAIDRLQHSPNTRRRIGI